MRTLTIILLTITVVSLPWVLLTWHLEYSHRTSSRTKLTEGDRELLQRAHDVLSRELGTMDYLRSEGEAR